MKGMRLVREFNEQFLSRLAECADSDKSTLSLLTQVPIQRLKGNTSAVRGAAQCPYLLADFAFTNSEFWTAWTQSRPTPRLLTISGGALPSVIAQGLAREALTTAWVCCDQGAGHASLLFGMAPDIATTIRRLRLADVERIAHSHASHLRPRWETQPALWSRMLSAALDENASQLHAGRIHGLQLLAGERHQRASREFQRTIVRPQSPVTTEIVSVTKVGTRPSPFKIEPTRETRHVVSSQARTNTSAAAQHVTD
jgi:hypothetical protein